MSNPPAHPPAPSPGPHRSRYGPRVRPILAGLFAIAMVAGILAFPRDGATLGVHSENGWTTSAAPRATIVQRGSTITFDVTVTSDVARSALVDIEINDPSGRKVFQDYWDGQSFVAGTAKRYSTTWDVPTGEVLGQYAVHVGIFRVGWGVMYHWNHAAATFEVRATSSSPPPATTTTVAPTTTRPPTTTTAPTTTVAPTTTRPPTTTTAPPPTTAPPGSVAFTEDFSTSAGFYNRFVTYTGNYCTPGVTCRPEDIGDSIKTFPGSHDMACSPPPSERNVSVDNHANLFWWCAPGGAATGHLMTGLSTSGYAIVSFSPNQTFTDVSRICWDQSLADLGGGIWNNVVIVPLAKYLSHPNENPSRVEEREGPYRMDYVTPGFDADNGPGDFNLQDIDGIFGVKQFRGTIGIYDGHDFVAQWGDEWTAGTEQSTRYRHCFTDNGNGTVTVTQQRGTGTATRTTAGSFPGGQVRVIFEDDHYDDLKHGGVPGMKTWHWDNISIS